MLRKNIGITQVNAINRTVIDKEAKIKGNVVANDIDILGIIDGNVEVSGKAAVIGTVKGNITGGDIAINGKVEGNIISTGLVYADKDAVITGDIEFGSILVEEGAVLKGSFRASKNEQSGGSNTGGIKIKWGKESNSSKEVKLRLKNLMNKKEQ